MRKYWILPHTADVRFKLEGDTLAELFTAGLEALGEILCQTKLPTGPLTAGEITLEAEDETALLIDFLSEVVSRGYSQKVLFTKVVWKELGKTSLKAKLYCLPVVNFDEDIKAVTYHEANIVKNKQGVYETTVVLDI